MKNNNVNGYSNQIVFFDGHVLNHVSIRDTCALRALKKV